MKTNKKKRLAGEDEGCPQDSTQNYSAVPSHDAKEVGEMVTMAHGGTSGGLHDDGVRTDYLQVASLLREKLNDLVDGDSGEFPGLGLRSLLDMAASSNIVSVDPKMLNRALWRALPKELLLLVLARLPFTDITRLRCLSREWRRDMATVNSEINLACQEASPPMIALLSHPRVDKEVDFLVTIYDITKCKWQCAYRIQLRSPWDDLEELSDRTWTAVAACDGGLVCFMSLWSPTSDDPLCIVVVNLLTRVQHELPPLHYQYYKLPAMVQMKVDFDTKCYKVFVAGRRKRSLTMEVYDSGTRRWTRAVPPCGSIFGPVYSWESVSPHVDFLSNRIPGAYDFREGKLELYSKNDPSIGDYDPFAGMCVLDSVYGRDRMFVLQKQPQMLTSLRELSIQGYCITEHHVENETKDWVQGKSYKCPFMYNEISPFTAMHLNACDGFLMVIFHHNPRWNYQYFWLLDLSTGEWSRLPQVPYWLLHTKRSVLCRAFWNVIS